MAASNLDKFKKSKRKFETTVGIGGILAGGTTLPLTSVTGLDTSTAVTLVIGAGTATEEVVTGVVSGSDLINCVRGKEGTTDSAHSAGETVNMFFTETHWDDAMDGILAEHDQDGTHGAVTASSVTATGAISSATLASSGALTVGTTLGVTGTATHSGASVLTGAISGAGYSVGTISNPYKFRVKLAGNGTIANGAVALFDTADYDTGSNVDLVTNKGRFTAPIAGFYHFSANLALLASSNNGVAFGARFKKNGTLVGVEVSQVNMYTGSYVLGCPVSDSLQLAANDYIEVVGIGPTSTTIGAGSSFEGFLISKT